MVQVDVTSPLTAGLNAASVGLGGYAHGQMAGDQMQNVKASLKARLQEHVDENDYRDKLIDLRLKEMARKVQDDELDRTYKERAFGMEDRRLAIAEEDQQLQVKDRESMGAASHFAKHFAGSVQAKSVSELERALSEQRSNALDFAAGTSPQGRAFVLQQLEQDEAEERDRFARSSAARKWNGIASNPALAQYASDPDVKALIDSGPEMAQAIESGAMTAKDAEKEFDATLKLASEKISRTKKYTETLLWMQQEIANRGGSNTDALHDAVSDFEALGPEDADPKQAKRAFLKAQHGLDLDTIKLGKVEIPASMNPRSPEWAEIAGDAAKQEAHERVRNDPRIKRRMEKGGDFTDEQYEAEVVKEQKAILRTYGAKYGMKYSEMAARGWGDKEEEKKVETNARAEIEKRLREAGIDPNKKIGQAAKPPARSDEMRRSPAGMQPPAEKGPLGSPGNPMLKDLEAATKKAEDEEFDEDDIEKAYSDG